MISPLAVAFWTQADIDALKAAITSGVLTVKYSGPPSREVTYRSLPEMRSLLAEMRREVEGAPVRRLVKFQKGFRDE